MRFSKAEASDAEAVSTLALEVCEQFIYGSTSEEGQETLRELYGPASVRRRIETGDRCVLAFQDEGLVGAAAMRREDNHVYLFFVAGHLHGHGLGRKLMRALVSGLDDANCVTLNSSMYAVGFYKRLGFEATGPVATAKGVEFLPMRLAV